MISFILLCLCVSEIFIQENICVCIRTLFVTSRTLSFCLCFCAYVFKRWVSLILFMFFFFKNRVWSNLSINDFARGGFRKLLFNFDTYAKRIRCFTIQIGPIFALCKYCQVLYVDCFLSLDPVKCTSQSVSLSVLPNNFKIWFVACKQLRRGDTF